MTVTPFDDGAIQPVPPRQTDDFAEIDQILMGSPPAAQFKDIGAMVTGKVLRVVARQATDFESKEPKWWPDGAPMMEPVITLQTADGPVTLYAGSSGMREALREACRQARAGLRPGGTLAIRYTADEPPKRKGMSGRKLYEAGYDPPPATLATRIEQDRAVQAAGSSRVTQMVTSQDPPF